MIHGEESRLLTFNDIETDFLDYCAISESFQ